MRKLKLLMLIVLSGVFIYSGTNIAIYWYDGYMSDKINARLKQQYEAALQARQAEADQHEAAGTESISPELLQELYEQRFKGLLELNPDVVGWISIAGTEIDYPVVRHTDNDYYLNHNLEQSRSSHGAIFMDYRNQSLLEDKHTVIYGHHMKDGSMFGELSNYKDETYYQAHNRIRLDGLKQSTEWQIFSVYVYTPEHQFFQFQYADEQEYSNYLQKIVEASSYDTEVEVSAEDQLLTLVTCTYEVSDARFIIHAKRIE